MKYILLLLLLPAASFAQTKDLYFTMGKKQQDTIFRPQLKGDSALKYFLIQLQEAEGAVSSIMDFGVHTPLETCVPYGDNGGVVCYFDTTMIQNKAFRKSRDFSRYLEEIYHQQIEELRWYYNAGYFPVTRRRSTFLDLVFNHLEGK